MILRVSAAEVAQLSDDAWLFVRPTAYTLSCAEATHAEGAADEVRCARGASAPGRRMARCQLHRTLRERELIGAPPAVLAIPARDGVDQRVAVSREGARNEAYRIRLVSRHCPARSQL
jgi:hypothetical protein